MLRRYSTVPLTTASRHNCSENGSVLLVPGKSRTRRCEVVLHALTGSALIRHKPRILDFYFYANVLELPNRVPTSRSFSDAFPLHALANPAFSPLTIELPPSIYVTPGRIRISELNPAARTNLIRRRVAIPGSEAQVEATNWATIGHIRVIHRVILRHFYSNEVANSW
jgi:hypothetical protein